MGLGFLGQVSTIKEARNKMHSLVEELKDFCLLIEDEYSEYVRMHDLVRDVANRIALRNHILSSVVDGGGHELKEWSDEDFLEKCIIISLPSGNNISRLPKVLQCQALSMLLLQGDQDDQSLMTILPTFFKEMKQLNVLALENMCIPSLPSSFQSLKNVQTLCLESCDLVDITVVGELSNLEILSFAYSNFEQLPQEIAQLTHLRLLDLTNCYQLQVIPPGVISNLTRLEDLRMDSFDKWDAEGEGSNASLLELKHLSRLTLLQINIKDANILPAKLFSCFELERYQIVIGCESWRKHFDAYDGTLNTLEIAGSIQLDKGLEMLMKKSHQLHLAGTFGAKNALDHQLDAEDFKQLKDLCLRENFDFTYFINRKVVFPNLTTLRVDECHGLRFLFSSSMAGSLKELKNLEVESCEIMEEIVLSTRKEDGEENMVNLFPKLQSVRLKSLPNLVRFCTSSYIEFSSLKELELVYCFKLESFICDPLNSGEKDREGTALQYSLYDEKVVECLSLETLKIEGSRKLQNIFPVAVARDLKQLHELTVSWCDKLEGIIGEEAEGEIENPPHDHELVFPNVSSLELRGLPKLKSFYTAGMHTSKWPSLKRLTLALDGYARASQVSLLFREKNDQMEPETTDRPLFLIQKDSFPQLEELELKSEELELGELTSPGEIWYGDGPSPADFFPKLKSVCFKYWAPFSNQAALLFLDKLQNLEKIQVEFDDSDEIIFLSGEIYALPRVRFLTLRWMENLLHLGNQEKSPVPNLQFLELDNCDGLNSLDQSSAIPFRNLTTLKVISCHGLKYLISYSVANSLVQLKTMQVEKCYNIEVIIATDGDIHDDDAAGNHEIVYFNCTWQHVKLRKLPRLQGFSSGNCIVKFPYLETFKASEDIDMKIDGVQAGSPNFKVQLGRGLGRYLVKQLSSEVYPDRGLEGTSNCPNICCKIRPASCCLEEQVASKRFTDSKYCNHDYQTM